MSDPFAPASDAENGVESGATAGGAETAPAVARRPRAITRRPPARQRAIPGAGIAGAVAPPEGVLSVPPDASSDSGPHVASTVSKQTELPNTPETVDTVRRTDEPPGQGALDATELPAGGDIVRGPVDSASPRPEAGAGPRLADGTAQRVGERRDRGNRRPQGGYAEQRPASHQADYQPMDRNNRGDQRPKRDWRDGGESQGSREQQSRQPNQRFSGSARDAHFLAPRDQRAGYIQPKGNGRNNGFREPYAEAPAIQRESTADGQVLPAARPADPVAQIPRPSDVITRGYVMSADQNLYTLRTHGYLASPNDATITIQVLRSYGLRVGDEVVGLVRPPYGGRRLAELLDVQSINGLPLNRNVTRPRFDDLTPIYPDRHIRLERPESVTARLIDLVSPIGFGQRALIVSPPKAGKTSILKEIGRSVNVNYPDVKLIVCLVGERPEEVTDLAKSLDSELISSTFDEAIAHHTELAELTSERARRLVESGFDVVVLLDSITRLARAYNLAAPGDSRSLSGGMATSALYPPKKFFGAARAFQEGGSLTIIATCLVDTNSRLDDVIYEELKGTGNMELVLDRRLAEERVFPAIDIVKSSTRREELLLHPNELTAVLRLRRALSMASDPIGNTRGIIQQMERTKTNAEFLAFLLNQTSPRS